MDVIEQLDAAVKWWNADEGEEPDVRRLFAACRAEIVKLREAGAKALEKFACPKRGWSGCNCEHCTLRRLLCTEGEGLPK